MSSVLTPFFFRTDSAAIERRAGWINVGDLSSAVHFKIVKYERIKFLVIGRPSRYWQCVIRDYNLF